MKNVKAGHKHPIVCLDAGHYGKYNRSAAVPAYYESDMTWKLHLLQKVELEKYGIEVRLTRASQDKDLALVSRGKASEGCDLFISDHSNATGSGVSETTDRVVVIVQLDGKGDELGEALAKEITDVMQTQQPYRVYTKEGSRGEYYGVLRGAAAVGTVGMILEHSFHTCTRSTKWLMDEKNLQRLAEREAAVIAAWFDVKKIEEPKPVELYRVQVGAYSKQAYAQERLREVKAAGFSDAFITLLDGLYKVQIGAFRKYEYAKAQLAAAEKAGFQAFITTKTGKAVAAVQVSGTIKVGSTVRVKQGAKTFTGNSLASFVYTRDHKVQSISGERVVITYGGVVVAAVNKKDLLLK